MAREKKSSIEGLKDKLYSRTERTLADPEARTPLSQNGVRPPTSWKGDSTPASDNDSDVAPAQKKKKWPLAVKFLIGSCIFFVGAAAVAVYMIFAGGNTISPDNIDLQIVMPTVIDGGKPTNVEVLINNRNQANLKLADLIINYPDGTRDPKNPSQALSHERQSIGDISSGGGAKRTSQAIFYGQEAQTEEISVQLQYSVEGSNAVFEKDATAQFTVGSSPVSISISAPSEAISDQQFAMDVTVQSNAQNPVNDVVVQAQYPFGFTPGPATPSATAGGTLWRLGTMQPGDTKVIHVTGTLDGQDGDDRVFYFLAGSDSDETDTKIPVPFLSVPQTLTVRRAFISAQIAVNGKTDKNISVPAGSQAQGTITWVNNLPDSVSDVQIVLTLKGPALDPNSVSSATGFYQSSNSTITWSKDQDATMAQVPPGGTGTLPFSFSTLPAGSGGTLYANPVVDLNVTIQGVRQGQDNVPQTVSSAASSEVLLSSIASVTAQALHFTGPFQNTGPMPPTPGQSTTYTLLWTVTNSSNTIANATVQATLPPYVTFVSAQQGSGITYDDKSRTVTWAMGDVKAGVGYTSASRTAAFQVSLLPSASQLTQAPALMSQATFSGQDRFAQVDVTASSQTPTTRLDGESGFSPNMGVITQ